MSKKKNVTSLFFYSIVNYYYFFCLLVKYHFEIEVFGSMIISSSRWGRYYKYLINYLKKIG